ncbi:hypothetical protein Aca07nite_72320 [Actinoplanes capillaceus]|uniref:DUF4192 domain-containing protein n=1 Tax=Actinoplanes campanulatus TaxID=113559 RepID=A0ABQ3WUI9_9ACTN|nr:DUF4192 domain-containing protein [Actinoplanes capillaceus]GID49957.1 hypothetical protein Aca07nite_72320 [Actinoplanes capillaceus]
MTDPETFDVYHPTDLAGLVPYLLRYHPHDQLVILGLRDTFILFGVAVRLPYSAEPRHDAASIVTLLLSHESDTAVLIGYGTHEDVMPAADAAREALAIGGVHVQTAMRIHDGRLWHLYCGDPDHELQGMPFDPRTTTTAAQATYLGMTAAPDIDAVAVRIAPITGLEQQQMHAALTTAHQQLDFLAVSSKDETRARLRGLADELIGKARTTYPDGRLPHNQAALLLALLTSPDLCDRVMGHVYGHELDIQIWTDLTRRADPAHTAAPATLLALAALQQGNGVLARLAIQRAQEADPGDQLVQLVAGAVIHGIAPDVIHHLIHQQDPGPNQ